MKKSTILSLATAATVVATSTFTFAAWDTTTATSTGTLTVGTPVTIYTTATPTYTTPENNALSADAPTYSADVTFNVTNSGSKVKNLTLSSVIEKSDGTNVTENFDIVYVEKTPGTELAGGIDSTIDAANQYTVKITPKDTSLQGQELKVNVTGTLS